MPNYQFTFINGDVLDVHADSYNDALGRLKKEVYPLIKDVKEQEYEEEEQE